MNKVSVVAALLGIATLPAISVAAPGKIQDAPLELGEYVQPNIMVLLDDSGSMDWEVLKSNGALTEYGTGNNSGNIDITPTPSDKLELLESCAFYNVMYYDPAQTYTPWSGVDIDKNAYANQDPTAARYNPYDPASGTIDLVNANDGALGIPGYIPYTDVNGDGVFDIGDCGDAGTTADMYANFVSVASMSAAERINFANWFSYYRKREYVAKRALSEVIFDSTERVGLATLWNNQFVGTLVRDIDDSEGDAQAGISKYILLNNLFRVDSNGGTPLRAKLNEVGRYYTIGDNPGSSLFGFTPAHSTTETASTDSPILRQSNGGECQRNFTLLFSDGYWNGGFNIANYDGATNTGQIDGFDGGTFADANGNTLADVAMRYLEFDLASTLDDKVGFDDPRTDLDINHQHMITYTVTFGLEGTLDRSVSPNDAAFAGWPTIVGNTNLTVDDMWHAAWNGRGENLNSKNPAELIEQIKEAFANFKGEAGSGAGATLSTGFLNTGAFIFQGKYNPVTQSGDLLAFDFDEDGVVDADSNGVIDDNDAIWSASKRLYNDLSGTGWQSRNIVTYNGNEGVAFEFPSNYNTLLNDGADYASGVISDKQIIDLLENAPYSIATSTASEITANALFGSNIVDYIKGDITNEDDGDAVNDLFRHREPDKALYRQFLGSIVHSSPQYVGIPDDPYPNLIEGVGNEYSSFITANETRIPMVYVGANDGMLHGFNALTGEEKFAYIPGTLENNLSAYTEPSYIYEAYVDGTPTIRDVFIGGQWKTLLVGGMRAGGKGIYILDVTDPVTLSNSSTAKNKILGEFTHPDLGYTFSRPQIARLNNDRWAVIFGNGYNAENDGRAKLFILYLDDLTDGIDSSDYIILDTGVGTIANSSCTDANSDCNGLSSPTLADLDGNFTTDRVYVGDVQGNLWAFNLESDVATDWSSTSSRTKLFTACSTAACSTVADRQPITTRPETRRHPSRRSTATSPNVMVFFGTGQYVAQGDNTNTDLQSFYAVWDGASGSGNASYANLTRTDLQEQTITGGLGVSNNAVSYDGSSNFGWYIDFEASPNVFEGGRSVVDSLLIGDIIFFNVTIPEPTPCEPAGESYLFALEAYDGTESDFFIFDTDGDGIADSSSPITKNVQATAGLGGASDKLIETGALGKITDTTVNTQVYIPAGRKTWSILDR